MNVIKLDKAQKAAIHTALCIGGGLGGAAQAARVDKRTLQKLVEGSAGDTFLTGLIEPEAITREEYDSLTSEYRLDGERVGNIPLRERYAQLLQKSYGDAIRNRLFTEEEKAEEARLEAEEAERKRKEKAEREGERRRERESKEATERMALCQRLYGESYERLYPVYAAYGLVYGTDKEISEGLGGDDMRLEREHRRAINGLDLRHHYIAGALYQRFFSDKKLAAEMAIISAVEKLVARYSIYRKNREVA